MPRKFTKAAAEKAGWTFVHDSGPKVLSEWETHQIVKTKPADLRAEKYLSPSQRIEEQAEDLPTLLARIEAFEADRASRGLS